MVIVEGLKRAEKNPTRDKFIEAIESMNDTDIGLGPAAHLQFSSHHHMGLGRVYPTVMHGGKPEVFGEWSVVLSQK